MMTDATVRFFFPQGEPSSIHEPDPLFREVKRALLSVDSMCPVAREVSSIREANFCVIRERSCYKGPDYPRKLASDPLTGPCLHKIITINTEDGPSGLLRGLYTSLPRSRHNPRFHRAVPYAVHGEPFPQPSPFKLHLASWRGNVRSNPMRRRLMALHGRAPGFQLEATESWFNHDEGEREHYTQLMRSSKFSLCPGGWAHATNRIYESMAHGVAPVIIADEFIPPSGPDWEKIALFIPLSRLKCLPTLLEEELGKADAMGKSARVAWSEFFSPEAIPAYYASQIIDLALRPHFLPNSEAELRRMNAIATRWKNGWTLPQRVVSRMRRLYSQQLHGASMQRINS